MKFKFIIFTIFLSAFFILQANAKDYRILVLPSGGASGVIPATLLAELEAQSGQPVYKLFDEIWGSSIGAMTAALLTLPKDIINDQNDLNSIPALGEPRSALEVAEFIKDVFSHYHNAVRVRGKFRALLKPSTQLKETLIPIRILSAKITEWFTGFVPQKIELASFCRENEGDLSLLSIACGSCSIPPVHRAEPLNLGDDQYTYCIDAGHEFCGSSSCMNPMFALMKQFSESIDLENDKIHLFFLGNGWVNLHPSWGTQGEVYMPGHNDRPISVNLFNINVDLNSIMQEWKSKTWTGWAFSSFQNNYIHGNLAGIGAIPTSVMKDVAKKIAQDSIVFQNMVNYLKNI